MSDARDTRSLPGPACPDDEAIAAFVAGQQETEQRNQLEAHFAECAACRRLLSALAPVELAESADPVAPTLIADQSPVREPGLRRGQVIDGKYEIETLLSAGGMGVLARARHRVLGTSVVIKLLRAPEVDEERLQRFLREARAGAALDSAFVARVLDAGILDNGRPYLVLEHLRGSDFAEILRKTGPLPVAEAVLYVLQAAEALAVAHARGIVHRDIKPANLFLADSSDGSRVLKVLDFGIAKAAEESGIGEAEQSLTGTSAVMGSPRYMSPEQLEHTAGVDARTDIWSLGTVLYELLSGQPAFDAPNLVGLASAIMTREPRPLGELCSGLPAQLEAVVARCLRKKRDERPANTAELAALLAPFAPVAAEPVIERIRRISERSSTVPAAVEPSAELPVWSPSRLKWPLLLLGVAAACAAIFFFWMRPRSPLLKSGLVSGALRIQTLPSSSPSNSSAPSASPSSAAPAQSAARPRRSGAAEAREARARRHEAMRGAPRAPRPPPSASSAVPEIQRSGLNDRK